MDGLLIVDKPAGPTSHDVVARIRRALREPRVGHTGTLDPAATGVLPLVLGRATRLARFLSSSDKSYDADIRLGVATDTCDAAGAPVGAHYTGAWPSVDEVSRALEAFRGQFLQQPPAFSAKKIGGERSYRIARRGSESDRRGQTGIRTRPDPVNVTAYAVDVVAVEGDRVSLRIHCSAGFYVRSLAHDLGQCLGTGAHLAGLRRIRSGDFKVSEALPLHTAESNPETARSAIIPLDRMLPELPAVVLSEEGAQRASHGRDLGRSDVVDGAPVSVSMVSMVRLLDRDGRLLAIGEVKDEPSVLHPSIVLM